MGTFALAVLGLLLSLPCALALALGQVSRWTVVRESARLVVFTMRATPLLMIIFWMYFLLPVILGTGIPSFVVMLTALVLYESAYLSRIIAAGIAALAPGQVEAANALGLTRWQTTRIVVLPQALYNSLPAMVNQFVSLTKETSLGYVIGVYELTYAAAQINSVLMTKPVQVFSILALTFFILCFTLTQAARAFENRIGAKRGLEEAYS